MKLIKKTLRFLQNIKKQLSLSTYAIYYKYAKIQEKTILYHAYRNNIMGGNPYGIFCQLMADPAYRDFTHIWIYRDDKNLSDDTFQRYRTCPNVRYVKSRTRRYYRALAACQFLISNAALPSYWVKKEGQTYINTWHGTPLKTLGRHAKDKNPSSIRNAQRNFFSCDYMVMPNRYTIEHMLDAYDLKGLFPGTVIDAGYPRTDLVLHTDAARIRGLLEKRLDHPLGDKRIVLYAPTFRSAQGKSLNTSREVGAYMSALLDALPPCYELFFKVHNMMAAFFSRDSQMKGRLIFDEIETNELLAATDILITDYSSIFFDFLCRQKPILFFVYDREGYADGRGLYLPLTELPGAVCETIEEIRAALLAICDGSYDYQDKMDRCRREFSYNDDGYAAQRITDIIFAQKSGMEDYLYPIDAPRDATLILGGSLHIPENKWACICALQKLSCGQDTVVLAARHVHTYAQELAAVSGDIRLIDVEPTFLMTLFEKLYCKLFGRPPADPGFFQRQYQKSFGGLSFSKVIDLGIDLDKKPLPWKDILDGHCDRYTAPPRLSSTDQLRQLRRQAGHPMTVLFLSAFDSVNYVYIDLIHGLEQRGHRTLLIVPDPEDTVNNKMFTAAQIPFIALKDFPLETLSEVDLVISTPFLNAQTRELRKRIEQRRIFCISFANLFSSITMRVYTDLIFAIGTSKFQEFEENGFHYSMVAAGNPQYDRLLRSVDSHRQPAQDTIRRVLFIDQGGYPFGEEGKRLLGQVILAMATHHPHKMFIVKPRYLPDELDANVLHHPSEHIYDFIPDPPDNLLLLRRTSILEDMMDEVDAVVTMWSTAYLDAALHGLPVMLIRGLPSREVSDVRNQRIEEAFARLEHTGCVVDYQKVLGGELLFHYVDEAFLKEEVENAGQPCTPVIIDTLEEIYEHLIIPGQRLADVIQTDIKTFRKDLPHFKKIDAQSNTYLQRRIFLRRLNSRLQALAFSNRSMAKPLQMQPFLKYWSFPTGKNFIRLRAKLLDLRVLHSIQKTKRSYFRPRRMTAETDPIRLDCYYDWLFQHKKYRHIMHFQNPHVFAETRAFYRAMVYFQRRAYADAAREFSAYHHHIQELSVKPLKKDRQIECSLFPKGLACAGFFETLYIQREFSLLRELCENARFDICMRTSYLLRVLLEEGEMDRFTECCQTFLEDTSEPARPQKGSGEKTRHDYYMECIQLSKKIDKSARTH